MTLEEVVNRFGGGKKLNDNSYQVKCPSHKDDKASLTITQEGYKILIYCHAGCDIKDILEAVGLSERDLFNDYYNAEKSKIVAEYIYCDENCKPLYKVIRLKPKNFFQCKYDNGNWVFKMTGVHYVLYNLFNVVKSDIVYFVEGEKDADNLNKIGLVATTSVGGASGFNKHKEEYIQYLKNKIIYVIPDNYESGYKYANNIKTALNGKAKEVKILKLRDEVKDLKEKEDISDVLEKYGENKTLAILDNLVNKDELLDFSGQTLSKEMLEEILKALNIKVGYNEITKEIDIEGLPEEYSSENAETILPIFIKEWLKKHRIKATKSYIEDLLLLIFDSHRYNPVMDMLKNGEWDETDRFNILYEIMGLTDEFDKKLVRKWFWQTASIVFNGYDNKKPYGIEGVLTLQGSQGCGKTRFCRNIALKTEWFTEGATIDMKIKDSLILASKGFIVELRRSGLYS